uniref:NADH-ubiquinone oxidoreductase chain 4 n=1 Tax=Obscurella hidalgoi TaxID=1663726 RepID=A0A0M3WMS3_OBSHI|nr:NADH dehydrogenase subunit 4 [Obscurella hidalgoi]AKL90686.1 NADH dehydrogenase subunit 4 [Obscurella hidalgoi]
MLSLLFLNIFVMCFYNFNFFWYFSIWILGVSAFMSLLNIWEPLTTFSLMTGLLYSDPMSSLLISLTLWISFLMLLASHPSVKELKNNISSFVSVILLLNLILILSFCLSDVIFFYFMFESSLLPTLILILGWGSQPERLQAGMYMMLYTISASLPLILLILWACQQLQTSKISYAALIRGAVEMPAYLLELLTFVVFLAFLVKLPMFSVHLWLPKAHVEAPVAGSMVLAAILLKLGGYGIIRIYQFFNFSFSNMTYVYLLLAVLGGLITNMICFRQIDMKSLIAYSSIGHMSLVLVGIFSGTSWGWAGALVLMMSHGFCSSGLFAMANCIYEKTHTRSLFLNKGMMSLWPIFSMCWFLLCALNMASPPSINLLGEIFIFPAALFSSIYLVFFLSTMSFLSTLCAMYLFMATEHGAEPKFSNSFNGISNLQITFAFLHWVPANFLIVSSQTISIWV